MERTFEDLRAIVMKEIDEINKKGELDENTLVCAYKLIDIVKDIHEIDEKMNGGYSQTSMYPHMMYGNSYGNSYANRNRDSMGRYSRDGYNSYRGYSREGDSDMMAKLEHMMNTAASETERQVLQRVMNQM